MAAGFLQTGGGNSCNISLAPPDAKAPSSPRPPARLPPPEGKPGCTERLRQVLSWSGGTRLRSGLQNLWAKSGRDPALQAELPARPGQGARQCVASMAGLSSLRPRELLLAGSNQSSAGPLGFQVFAAPSKTPKKWHFAKTCLQKND